jgi:DNA helicase II / ATP-dependent DNA helicase PcrA
MLILAGAGSGKTRVVTFRIAHLLSQGIPPQAICALTFTNKAAEEMRERVSHLLGDKRSAQALTMGTFHALGLQILRTERKALGFPRGFVIYDQSDQMGALREVLRNVHEFGSGDGAERRYDAKAILARISLAKNAFIAPEDYKPKESDEYDHVTAQVYPRYQEALRAAGAFDFDDLITEPVRLFQRDPACGDRWAAKFRYVMVDEYQDTNRAQLRMVQHLVRDHGNLVVVGDDDQSIYSWRGADPSNILQFGSMFPGAKIVKLEQNYRSTRTILDAANAVIANNEKRHGKKLWSEHGLGEVITHAVAPTVEDEAKWVVREITKLQKDGRRWADIAIMYRSNVQAKLLEEELRAATVPYVMYGGQQFFERKEVKDVIAYMRVAINPRDDLAVRRVLNYPARGIGATTIDRLVSTAYARHTPLWEVLRGVAATEPLFASYNEAQATPANALDVGDDPDDLAEERTLWGPLLARPGEQRGGGGATPEASAPDAKPAKKFDAKAGKPVKPGSFPELDIRGAARNGILEFVHIVTRLATSLGNGIDAVTCAKALVEQAKIYDDLRSAAASMSAAQRRIDNVESLFGTLTRHQEKVRTREGLAQLLRSLSLETSDDREDAGDRVILTTLHGSKGLEFPVCFMVGLEEELLPHARTLQPQATDMMDADHATDISEERRLCYVGITRAQRKLYLTRACTRVSRGKAGPRTPSRFLLEIPDELLEVKDLASEAKEAVPTDEIRSFFSSFSVDE